MFPENGRFVRAKIAKYQLILTYITVKRHDSKCILDPSLKLVLAVVCVCLLWHFLAFKPLNLIKIFSDRPNLDKRPFMLPKSIL